MFFGLKMKRLVNESGFKSCDGVYYGYIDNYLASISYHGSNYELFIEMPVYSLSRDIYDNIKDYILEHSDENGITAYSINSSGISFFFNGFSFKKLYLFINIFLSELGPCPDSAKNICGNCGNPVSGNGKFVRIGYHVHYVDSSCAEILNNSPPERKTASSKGHPVSGMVGSVLFALIALSGYLLAAYKGYLCSWILFFIPVLLMFGFTLFGGKPSAFMVVLVTVVPVLFFLLSLVGLLSVEIGINWFSEGYTFTVGQLLSHAAAYFRSDSLNGSSFFAGQVLTGGIFLILGIIFSITFSFKAKQISNVHLIEENAA